MSDHLQVYSSIDTSEEIPLALIRIPACAKCWNVEQPKAMDATSSWEVFWFRVLLGAGFALQSFQLMETYPRIAVLGAISNVPVVPWNAMWWRTQVLTQCLGWVFQLTKDSVPLTTSILLAEPKLATQTSDTALTPAQRCKLGSYNSYSLSLLYMFSSLHPPGRKGLFVTHL